MQEAIRTYHSSDKTPVRLALIEEARRINGRHHITFAFNAHYTYAKALELLRAWDEMLMHRLYRRRAFKLANEEVFNYVLFPEHGSYIHFHGVINVPKEKLWHFSRIAGARWTACVPTGNLYFGEIGPTSDDEQRWLNYITKSSTATDYLTSAFLRLRYASEDSFISA